MPAQRARQPCQANPSTQRRPSRAYAPCATSSRSSYCLAHCLWLPAQIARRPRGCLCVLALVANPFECYAPQHVQARHTTDELSVAAGRLRRAAPTWSPLGRAGDCRHPACSEACRGARPYRARVQPAGAVRTVHRCCKRLLRRRSSFCSRVRSCPPPKYLCAPVFATGHAVGAPVSARGLVRALQKHRRPARPPPTILATKAVHAVCFAGAWLNAVKLETCTTGRAHAQVLPRLRVPTSNRMLAPRQIRLRTALSRGGRAYTTTVSLSCHATRRRMEASCRYKRHAALSRTPGSGVHSRLIGSLAAPRCAPRPMLRPRTRSGTAAARSLRNGGARRPGAAAPRRHAAAAHWATARAASQ